MNDPIMSRVFSMPNPATFEMAPVAAFIARNMKQGLIVDPFARNARVADLTNDINPATTALYHLDAWEFLGTLRGRKATTILLDPPYSPRQISECYRAIGRQVTAHDTQNAKLYRRVKDAADAILSPGGVVLSFGWNSGGMGLKRGYKMAEIMLVAHGGAHNDTICVAEVKE